MTRPILRYHGGKFRIADWVLRGATQRVSRREIKAAIRFYERRGWCWFGIVEYLCWRSDQ